MVTCSSEFSITYHEIVNKFHEISIQSQIYFSPIVVSINWGLKNQSPNYPCQNLEVYPIC